MDTETTGQAGLSIAGAERIWLGNSGPGPQTRLFRKVIDTPRMPRSVRLELFAETTYNLWVNGRYVQRGPAFHHPHRRPAARIDLMQGPDPSNPQCLWRQGANAIAVMVHVRNIPTHNHIPSGEPGMMAAVLIEHADGRIERHFSDATWRATDRTGWLENGPKRNWALGPVEVFDVAAAPAGWQEISFDDGAWSAADVCRPTSSIQGATWLDNPLPLLRVAWAPAAVGGLCEAAASPYTPTAADGGGKYAEYLTSQAWQPARAAAMRGAVNTDGGGYAVTGLAAGRDTMLWGDLGRLCAGQVILECDCPSDGIIDICWSETLKDGLPELVRKGSPYADRIIAAAGRLRWQPIGFSSARYVAAIFRSFDGTVSIQRLGMRASEPALNWAGHFECDDERLNGIWRLCERTIRVGTQEGLVDCPSREQGTYIGDGHPVARWLAELTGDYAHWRYLVEESFARPARDGLIRTTLFTGSRQQLIDYTLLAVIGTRDYLAASGDAAAVAKIMPHCRRLLGWFAQRMGDDGLLHYGMESLDQSHTWEQQYDPQHWDEGGLGMILFIDHPGLGWHNKEEPGIDRRGINAAMNALLVLALEAMAELEETVGDAGEPSATGKKSAAAENCRRQARALAQAAGKAFYRSDQHAFADGLVDGQLSAQISQQTNTWCLEAALLPVDRQREVVARILRRDDAAIARSGPYFWYYMFPLLARCGMHAEALDEIRRLWGPMLDAGATTLWETFAGDYLDTWCHPWSAAPTGFLLNEILGLDPLRLAGPAAAIRPRTDLLGSARGRIALPSGVVEVQWNRTGSGELVLSGELPEGLAARLEAPDGRFLAAISGSWRHVC